MQVMRTGNMRFPEKFIFPSQWVSKRSRPVLRKWPERPRFTEKDKGAQSGCQPNPTCFAPSSPPAGPYDAAPRYDVFAPAVAGASVCAANERRAEDFLTF